jgi:hypothetical protein
MSFVQAVIFGCEEAAPCPEVFVALVTVDSGFDWINFTHTDRRQRTVIARADQNVDRCSLKLGPNGNAFLVTAIEDESDNSRRAFSLRRP